MITTLNTELKNRTLWYDGDTSYDPSRILEAMSSGNDVKYVNALTPEIEQFNQHAAASDRLQIKTQCRKLSREWNLPSPYNTLDVVDYLINKHIEITKDLSPEEVAARDKRLITELSIYGKKQLFDVLRTIIFIINTLSASNVPWGVGRGSSVSSYVLFVIGVHDVDSFKYNLPIDDFLHDQGR